ncbi:MAG: hypothetical protein NTZ34_00860 [Chloroflexi bacterium]|nr:hypothetical protein [Chloroflexota bacterium]
MVEPLGINGEGGRPDVTVFFFGLKKETQESVAPAYTPVSPSISTTTTVIKGDGNGDGKISMNDALYAFQMAIGRRPVDLNLDMDGNDKVNIFDAIQLLILAVRPGKTNLPENTNISVGSSNKNTSEKTSRPIIPTGDESAKRCQPSEKTYKLGENIDAEILIKILGEKDGNCLVYEKIVKDNTPNNLVGKEMNCKICTCSTNGIVPIGDNIKEYCTGSLADAIDELYKRAKGK